MSNLTFGERMSLAFKALTTQFDTQGSSIARQFMAGIFPASTGPAPARNNYQLLNTMNESPWVRACAGRVADARASIMWRAYAIKKNGKIADQRDVEYIQKAPHVHRQMLLKEIAQDGELVELPDHIMMSMMRRGSSALTGWDTRWLQSVYLDLAGECFLLKQRNEMGVPVASWIIPPHWVAETPTPKRPAFRLAWKAFNADIPESEVMWMKQPNCLEPYERGSGIAKSLDDDLATDEFAAKHTLKFFKNSARPDLLVMPKDGQWDESEKDRFEEWWNNKLQGFWRSFKPLFLKSPVEVKLIESKFRDMQLTELRQHERDTVMQVWGIPPEIFGVLSSSNRSTIDQSGTIFMKYCIVPRLERERDFYQDRLVPEYDDGKNRIILDYVSPVPEDKEFKLKVMVAQPAAFELNEFREMANFDPLDDLDGELAQAAGAGGFGADPNADPQAEDQPKKKPKPKFENLDDEEAAALYMINRKLVG